MVSATAAGMSILVACAPGQQAQSSGLDGKTPVQLVLWDRDEADYDQFMNVWQQEPE